MSHVLIVVDLQQDFCPGGALAVPGGDEIVSSINGMLGLYDSVVLTQDWHPLDHSSFAENHLGAEPYQVVPMPYGSQILWPCHCVAGSQGAEFHPDLDQSRADLILRKGFRREIDSYSAFFENDHRTPTGLASYLRERGLTHLSFAGLAEDFCVTWSAIDATRLGFKVRVISDACRAIDVNGSLAAARDGMRRAGVDFA
ncbi:MAG: bifunctional nicotinamidase/pyrazinamidase [Paracoccus sp.]|nr:bifunctional nicotinamidase/pyrazinamidase [Paracoccus sp. (in: a-proteobacteria)]